MGRSLRGGYPRWEFSWKLKSTTFFVVFIFCILNFFFRFWRDSSARGQAAEEGCGRHCQEFSFKIQFFRRQNLPPSEFQIWLQMIFWFSGISMRLWFWWRRKAGDCKGVRSLTKEIHFFCKRNPFPPEEEIFFVFQRNRFLTEKKSTWKKARHEVRPMLATISSVPSSLTDLIKLSSSQNKNVGTHLI